MFLGILTSTIILLVGYFIHRIYIMTNTKILYLIRGIPGSGKSTLAKQLALTNNMDHFEADMYFIDEDGKYNFDLNHLMNAHDWCFDQVNRRLLRGKSVIVSNTFTRWREMREYVETAMENGYDVKIIHCLGDFGSIHCVPEEAMKRMRDRILPNESLPQLQGITYSTHLPVADCAGLST